MKVSGVICNLQADGFERLISIKLSNTNIIAAYIQPNEYLDYGEKSEHLDLEEHITALLKIQFITEFKREFLNHSSVFRQRKSISPSVEAIGIIKQIIEKHDVYLLDLKEHGDIIIEFESDTEPPLRIGECISLTGELTIEALQIDS